MKTRLPAPNAVVASLIALAFACSLAGAEAPKDHHLIVGSDFTVKLKGKVHPVVGAGNRTFLVKEDDRVAEMPLRKLKDIQIARGLKLTRQSARLSKIEAVLSSDTLAAEQHEAAQTSMAMASMASIQRDKAFGAMLDMDISRVAYDSTNPVMGVAQTIANIEAKMGDAWKAAVAAEQLMQSQQSFMQDLMIATASRPVNDGAEIELIPEIGPTSAYLIVPGGLPKPVAKVAAEAAPEEVPRVRNAGGDMSDRFDLEFHLSSPARIENAYLVLLTEYSAPKQHGTEVFRRVLTEKVGTIDAIPRRISLYQTGFPPGFQLRTYIVSLYADGQEIATNLSDSKMTMTRDEAQQYVFAEHLAANRGKTLPPAAVLMTSRSELRQLAADPLARQPVYVSVDENGQVVEVSTDSRSKRPPSPTIASALEHFCFVPALKNGVPAAGRAKLVVTEFLR